MLKQMKETNNKSIANAVGAGLVSAQKEKTINKFIADAVGVAPQGDPQTKNIKDKPVANVVGADSISAHKKTINDNLTANIVGADDPVCPIFEEPTQNKRSPKDNSNLISNFQPLTSDHRGITLIALVITIIIMLILVTVTITVALKGELFNTAKQAKTETENKINEEQNLASGKVEIDGEWYNSIEEYTTGRVTPTVDNYGEFVEYGVDLNGDNDYENDWKVFYVDDKGRTFIIAADYVSSNKCDALKTATSAANMTETTSDDKYKSHCYYWSSTDVNEGESQKVKYHCNDGHNDLNNSKDPCSFPDIFMGTGYYCSDHVGDNGASGNPNSRCASSLMCTDNWSSFVDKSYGATYAIGGPTLEMWVASWNQKHGNNTSDTTKPLYCTGESSDDYGYCVGTTPSSTSTYVVGSDYYGESKEGYNDTLYFPHQNESNLSLDGDGKSNDYCPCYLLASPTSGHSALLMCVYYNGVVGFCPAFSYERLRPSSHSLSNIWSQIGKISIILELSLYPRFLE